jgi:hypothetical protein
VGATLLPIWVLPLYPHRVCTLEPLHMAATLVPICVLLLSHLNLVLLLYPLKLRARLVPIWVLVEYPDGWYSFSTRIPRCYSCTYVGASLVPIWGLLLRPLSLVLPLRPHWCYSCVPNMGATPLPIWLLIVCP